MLYTECDSSCQYPSQDLARYAGTFDQLEITSWLSMCLGMSRVLNRPEEGRGSFPSMFAAGQQGIGLLQLLLSFWTWGRRAQRPFGFERLKMCMEQDDTSRLLPLQNSIDLVIV
jgi:hypothetical protein